MANNIKLIRGQIRQIVKEILPDVLSSEYSNALYKKLSAEIQGKLTQIEANVTETLKRIDERAKDLQMFMMRQALQQQAPAVGAPITDAEIESARKAFQLKQEAQQATTEMETKVEETK